MTRQDWNSLKRGDMVRTTKKLLVVCDVRPGTDANTLLLSWVNVDSRGHRVTVGGYKTADYGVYNYAGVLPAGSLLTNGEMFNKNDGCTCVAAQPEPEIKPRPLMQRLRDAFTAFVRAFNDGLPEEWL